MLYEYDILYSANKSNLSVNTIICSVSDYNKWKLDTIRYSNYTSNFTHIFDDHCLNYYNFLENNKFTLIEKIIINNTSFIFISYGD